jgi:protein gp37
MGDKSAIQWTDATWNPSTGCSKVSPGCKNCYAERLAGRLKMMGNPKYKKGFKFTLHEDALDIPLKWNRPRKIFVNSMSDLFHESMKDDFLEKCFEVMTKANWHVYQILTKRPEKMLSFTKRYGKIPDHIWLGTSVELALYKDRIDILRNVPAKVKFVSFEPLLGPLGELDLAGISWAIAGGESGPSFRKVEADWIREIRKQCKKQGVAFFFKQWGGIRPKSGGRILDGKEWNEYPKMNTKPNDIHSKSSKTILIPQ